MVYKKFNIHTLGCKINQYDSASLKSFLLQSGLQYSEESADFIIINSCSVTKTAIRKAQSLINSVKKNNPQSAVILIGCWPRVYKAPEVSQVDLVWNGKSEEWGQLLSEINKLFPLDVSLDVARKKAVLNSIGDRRRYFLKIQDGCRQFCSYCVIPFARGPLKSKPVDDVLSEVELAISSGYQEVVLSGIHLGLYGKDFPGEVDLFALLEKIIKVKNLKRIRLSSIEVNELNDDILKLAAKSDGKICPHFHISLQSGSDKILKLMNRPYNSAYFLERVDKIRKLIPGVSISTDLIVGFPGETEKDFRDSYQFCQKVSFDKIHVFSFSAHEKAAAFNFPDKNSPAIIKQRSQKMRALSQRLEKQALNNILKNNNFLDVLIEEQFGGRAKGKTQYYFDYSFEIEGFATENQKVKVGEIVRLNLKK